MKSKWTWLQSIELQIKEHLHCDIQLLHITGTASDMTSPIYTHPNMKMRGGKKTEPTFQTRNCLIYAESWYMNNFWMAGVWDFYRGVSTVWQQMIVQKLYNGDLCWSDRVLQLKTGKRNRFHPHQFYYVKAKRSVTVIVLPNWSEIIYFMLKIDINSIREKTDKYESIHFI